MVSKHRAVSAVMPFFLGALALATPTLGQAPNDPASSTSRLPERPDWGGADRVLRPIGYSEFEPTDSSTSYLTLNGRYSTVPSGVFHATPDLPSGVLLTYLELDFCDNTGSGNVRLTLLECDFLMGDCHALSFIESNGAPGCGFVTDDLTPDNYVINNNSRRLVLIAVTESGGQSNQVIGAYIGYKLQVSPAPASATFLDVPTGHPYFRFVEALVDAGITAGCGGGNYCVNAPITRGEMAVFLSAALGLHFPN